MSGELGVESRGELLAGYFAAYAKARRGGQDELASALDRLTALEDRYLEGLPEVAISRSPQTGEIFRHSLDAAGLDGLWWRYEDPVRPFGEELPETVFAFTGAVRIAEPVEVSPFLCKPGPEAPFVIPRILRDESIQAVVSQIGIGPHTGYAIVYFSEEPPDALGRFNTWGAGRYETYRGWDSIAEDSERIDFDLARWMDRGKVLWIAPGDDHLVLRFGIDGCPFLDLHGRRSFTRIQAGDVWGGGPP